MLCALPDTNPTLFAELSRGQLVDTTHDVEPNDLDPDFTDINDDSNIPLHIVTDVIESGNIPSGFVLADGGFLARSTVAEEEASDKTTIEGNEIEPELELPTVSCCGRIIKPSRRYQGNV